MITATFTFLSQVVFHIHIFFFLITTLFSVTPSVVDFVCALLKLWII